jgi:RNA polymerase sigma-70 factor (ECF subfamily)
MAELVSAALDPVTFDGAPLDDDYLVRQARRGSGHAFETLAARHQDRVFRLALRLTGDRTAAEDIAQEVLVAAWRGLPGFRGDASFTTWLYRITSNAAHTHWTRQRVHTRITGDEPAATSEQPEQVTENKGRAAALHQAIAALPFDQRTALVLYQFERLSYEQCADVLGVSVSTIRGRIARARHALVETMRAWR